MHNVCIQMLFTAWKKEYVRNRTDGSSFRIKQKQLTESKKCTSCTQLHSSRNVCIYAGHC